MAFIGMRHVVAAQFKSHTNGSEPVYENTGMDVGKAINANLTITRNNNPLYGDDAIAEDDNSVTGMELEVGLDDLDEEVQDYLGLLTKKTSTGTPAVTTYYDTSASAKDVGFGYIRVRRKLGVTTYQGVWNYKAKFSIGSESSQTKGESIEWQTPTANARLAGLDVDGSGEATFRKKQNFDTAAAAEAWLDGLANITR